MGRIRVLDDPLINRIAAGEVVERPASVLKELVENSLDAGAGVIRVELEAGGKRRIRVADDGRGMDRDDAVLALERHATSKIRSAADLDTISTLGFRGEALPSIAAVSRFLLRSAAVDGEGTEVEVRGGRVMGVRETALTRGTWIEVAALFFNVPARRKFLRADGTELSHALRDFTGHALAHTDVHFHLEHAGRALVDAPPTADLEERVAQIFGRERVGRLIPFSLERGGISTHGLAGRPTETLPRRDAQYLFVNGRVVRDRVLAHALAAAYGNTMPSGRHPAVFLFLRMDPSMVDVNVHPRKAEVRFRESSRVHDLVRDAVSSALASSRSVPALSDLRPEAARRTETAAAALRYLTSAEEHREPPFRHSGAAGAEAVLSEPGTHSPAPVPEREGPGEAASQPETTVVPRVLAQFLDSYIVAQRGRNLLLVDQHVAHERVLFERFLAEAEENRPTVQRLLFPVTVELPPAGYALVETEMEEFRRLGFVLEPFGGRTVRMDAVPAAAGHLDPADLLRNLVGEATGAASAISAAKPLRHRLVTTAACKAAIKVPHPLTREEMQRLLEDLFRTTNPTTCPHGRPILFQLSLEEIERAVRRQ